MEWKSPVLMVGIDAATWDVILPLLEAGRLPNIARLMREGTWGRLKSFTQYVSPALWTSITTGKMPEKHGVQDFYSETRLHLQSPAIYDILGGEEGRVGLFRWFASWPPPQNAGFTVPDSVARSPDTYPAQLHFLNDLLRPSGFRSYLQGGAQLLRHGVRSSTLLRAIAEMAYEVVARPQQLDWWYRRRFIETAIYGDVFIDLLRKYRPDFAAILLYHTDDISHRFWRYRQPELFGDVPPAEINKYGPVIDRAYTEADAVLGKILEAVPDDTLVVVLSDHGQQAGPAYDTPYRMSQDLISRVGFKDQVWLTYLGYSAFLRPAVEAEGAELLEKLAGSLEQVRFRETGAPVFRISVSETDQLVVDVIPGVDADLNLPVSLPGEHTSRLGDLIFTDGRLSGIHSEWGILILKGPGVRKECRMEDATILDVAPTILALKNRPVAQDMDGRVIEDVFEDGFFNRYPLRFIESYGTLQQAGEVQFAEEELEELEERLRGLGYL